jgi:hypothetical protein
MRSRNIILAVMLLLFAGLFLSIGIFGHTHTPLGPPVVMQVLDPSLEPYAAAWQAEIGRRFPHSVGILCHGGYFVEGQWLTSSIEYRHLTTVQEVVKHVQTQYPDRVVVLLVCNVDHHILGIPGVYYAHSSIWCVPDRAITGSGLDQLKLCATHQLPIPVRKVTPDIQPVVQPHQPDADYIVAEKSRWETDPEVVGNIYEFTAD